MIADIIIAFALYLVREALRDLWPVPHTYARRHIFVFIDVVIIIVSMMAIVDAVFR